MKHNSNTGTAPSVKNFKGTLGRLLKYLKPERKQIIAIIFFSIISITCTIFIPFLLGTITTELADSIRFTRAINFTLIFRCIIAGIAAGVLSNLFNFISGIIASKLSCIVAFRLRKELKNKLALLPLSYFDKTTKGDLLSRIINDVDLIINSLQQSLTQIITGILTIVGIAVAMFIINVWLSLITVIAIPITALFAMLIARHSQKQFVSQQRNIGDLNAHIEEMFSGQNVIKLYGKEDDVINEFERINAKLKTANTKAMTFGGMIMPVTKLINNLVYIGICLLGGFFCISGTIGVGVIQMFVSYSRQFMQPIVQIAEIANIIQSTAAASERVFEMLDAEEEIKDINELKPIEAINLLDRDNLIEKINLSPEQQANLLKNENKDSLLEVSSESIEKCLTETQKEMLLKPLSTKDIQGNIHFDDVFFGYTKDKMLIKNMNLEIKSGSTVAIVGPTGAGKTTLVNLLLRFYEINSGSIDIDNIDSRNLTRSDLRDLFGMVLQDTWLFKGTIKENLAYSKPDATLDEIMDAAKKAHVHHYITTLQHGYDTILEEDASNISQGQKQLLTIARAILADRKILILDEATSSVDTRTEAYIQNAMTAMMEGKTSFVIAHRLSTIKNADMILVMNNGSVVEHGTHSQLLEQKGIYFNLYNCQFNNSQTA